MGAKFDKRKLRRVERFFAKLDVPIDWNYDGVPDYTFDGKIIRPNSPYLAMRMHDAVHWLVAPPERRDKIEFGLGPDPGNDSDAKLLISQDEADHEEYVVCEYNVLLAIHLELEARAVFSDLGIFTIEKRNANRMVADGLLPKRALNHVLWVAKQMGIRVV